MIPLLAALASAETVAEAFPPPPGAARVPTDSFGAWLGTLSLRPEGTPVLTHDGRVVGGHPARVVDLPLVPGDLQQCADSAIRLRAEWLNAQGLPVSFHATSGDEIPWARWQAGERPFSSGNRLFWRPSWGTPVFDEYLAAVFRWAGTRSLAAYDTVPADRPRAGDVLVEPGSPGHAVLLLDVATDGERTWVLIGEGFMPAQDFHVELGPVGGWWPYTDGVALDHWTLPATSLRRWR